MNTMLVENAGDDIIRYLKMWDQTDSHSFIIFLLLQRELNWDKSEAGLRIQKIGRCIIIMWLYSKKR